jgi:hypothetical protein
VESVHKEIPEMIACPSGQKKKRFCLGRSRRGETPNHLRIDADNHPLWGKLRKKSPPSIFRREDFLA